MKNILLIQNIEVHNANALSSPYTIGFPAMTAWLGGTHALQRQLSNTKFNKVIFSGVGVVCHDFHLQVHKNPGDFVESIVGTSNPLGKDGQRPSFIEEARCHLTISLVIQCDQMYFDRDERKEFTSVISDFLNSSMKLAGGDIISFKKIEVLKIIEESDRNRLIKKLMPGYAIIERRDLMVNAMKGGQNAIDAIIDYLKVMHRSHLNKEISTVEWKSERKTTGWIVPIATGFHGITPLSNAVNQRDPEVLHRFAESIVTLGEFIMPYNIQNLDEILWHTYVDTVNDLYLCQQKKSLKFI